ATAERLEYNHASNRIRAATFGRGLWETPIDNYDRTVTRPDAMIRDSYVDVGHEPDTETGAVLWESPDIWVRNLPDQVITDSPYRYLHEGYHQNPLYSNLSTHQPYVYVRIQNRGTQPVSGAVQMYWAQASTGLVWPASWTTPPTGGTVGTISLIPVITIQPGAVFVAERQWTNMPDPNVTGDQHYCLLARFIPDASTPDPIV